MADIAELGIRVISSGAEKATSDLKGLSVAAEKAEASTVSLSAAASRMDAPLAGVARGSVAAGSNVRMLTQQLSQVGQMTMATGDVVSALAIRLPDMGLAFGSVGTAVGLLAGIALPMLMNAFTSTGEAAKTFKEHVDDLRDAVQAVDDIAKMHSAQGLEDLRKKYGDVNAEILTLIDRQGQLAVAQANEKASQTISALAKEYGALNIQLQGTLPATLGARQQLDAMASSLGISRDEAGKLARAIQDASNAKDSLGRADAIARVLSILQNSNASTGDLYASLLDAEAALRQLANAAPSASWLGAAIDNAKTLATNIWNAVAAKAAYYSAFATGTSLAPVTSPHPPTRPGSLIDGSTGDASAGAGAKAVDPLQTRIEQLQKTLSTQRDIELAAYAQQQDDLRAAYEQHLITQAEYNQLIEAAETNHAANMAQIKQKESAMVQNAAEGMYGALDGFLGVFAGKSKAAAIASIILNKALSIAHIIQNTGVAATRALAELGPIAGPPAAAKIIAFGRVQAALVAATGLAQAANVGGGGGIGGGSSSAAAQGGNAPEVQKVEYTVRGLDKSKSYTGEELAMIFDGLAEESKKRGLNQQTSWVFV